MAAIPVQTATVALISPAITVQTATVALISPAIIVPISEQTGPVKT